MNICGCLVQVSAANAETAQATLAAMSGVEIHAVGDNGRLVVVVEDADGLRASDQIMAMHQIPGVISVTLNYHHFEDPSQSAPLATS